jgi:hypothetical protein
MPGVTNDDTRGAVEAVVVAEEPAICGDTPITPKSEGVTAVPVTRAGPSGRAIVDGTVRYAANVSRVRAVSCHA